MFDAEKFLQSGFMESMPESIRMKVRQNGIRNALVLTEAPTGKISLLAGVNSGIEPVFSFSYIQKDRLGERTMYHPLYQSWIDQNGEDNIPDYFVTADDLTPDEHVAIQALIQKYTDSSISKTVNAPEVHTLEDVKKLYELAYETGCKGISYMREGSREGTLIRKKDEDKQSLRPGLKKEEQKKEVIEESLWSRPTRITGATYRLKTPVGTAFITINHDEYNSPVELFINIGHTGSDIQALAEALGRVISKSLRFGTTLTIKERAVLMIEQLQGIGSSRSVGFGSEKISSLPDAVAKALAMDMGLLANAHKEADDALPLSVNGNGHAHEATQLSLSQETGELPFITKKADICPDCGNATLVNEMGCQTCYGCGYSAC
jgi:ribonucleoside-diphosphate reductase alpha chain